MTEMRKNKIEEILKQMNEILSILVKKSDNGIEYHKKMIYFLRNIASLRDRMLECEKVEIDATIEEEVAMLETEAMEFLSSSSMHNKANTMQIISM